MPALANKLGSALGQQAPAAASLISQRVATFLHSLDPLLQKTSSLVNQSRGVAVTATEPVFGYMAADLRFKMLNHDFQFAVMNDTEPSAAQTAAFEKSLRTHDAKILFYNSQVTDPTTDRMKKIAQASGVPIVGVTETQPAELETYVDWMSHELDAVQAGLKAAPR
jgi:zinc/manganese transport system substrate-binding protein